MSRVIKETKVLYVSAILGLHAPLRRLTQEGWEVLSMQFMPSRVADSEWLVVAVKYEDEVAP